MLNIIKNKTFNGETAPKSTWITFCVVGAFKDTIFQFISLFLLLFIQYGTNLPLDPNYNLYFLVITIGLILIKTVVLFFVIPFMSHLSNIIKPKLILGNFRPWIFYGSFMSMAFFLLMFLNNFNGWLFVVTFLIEYLFFEMFFSWNDMAYWGFFTTMTSVEKTRTKFAAISSGCIAVGTYALISITPAISSGHTSLVIKIIALVIAVLFVLSSLILILVMKEKPMKIEYESHYSDCFKIIKNNKYARSALLMFTCFFAGQFILMGTSVNLFNYTYGYGSEPIYGSLLGSGGFLGVYFIFSITYGVSSTISQLLYPIIHKKHTRKEIMIASTIGMTIMYLLIYFLLSMRANIYLLFVGVFILLLFQGQVNSIVLMVNNLSIEYNEYICGERRDKDYNAIREVFGKFSGGIQTVLFYIFLLVSGLFTLNKSIGNEEAKGIIDSSYDVVGNINKLITQTISSSDFDPKLMIFKILVYLIPMLLMWLVLFIYLRYFKLDENEYEKILKTIKERRKINEK